MKTYSAKPVDIKRKLHVIDAADKTLGRLSIQIARILMGKDKPIYTPTIDTGDFVTVINAAKVRVTGKKLEQKDLLPPFQLSGRLQEHHAGQDDGEVPYPGYRILR